MERRRERDEGKMEAPVGKTIETNYINKRRGRYKVV